MMKFEREPTKKRKAAPIPFSLFGVHEVRLLGPTGVSAGYFDNWDAALQAVASEARQQYKAAYVSLNPIEMDGVTLNPRSLSRASVTASDANISAAESGCLWTWTRRGPRAPTPQKPFRSKLRENRLSV